MFKVIVFIEWLYNIGYWCFVYCFTVVCLSFFSVVGNWYTMLRKYSMGFIYVKGIISFFFRKVVFLELVFGYRWVIFIIWKFNFYFFEG